MKVLVTGAGALLGQGIIRALQASSLKAEIVAVDPSPLSAGLYWVDRAYLVEVAKSPRYLDRFGEILAEERPDIVLVGTDVELPVLAAARAEIEARYKTTVLVSDPRVIDIANDKWLTSRFLEEQGLPFVPSALPEEPGAVAALVAKVGFPLIVKPRVGARSVGVHLVETEGALSRALDGQAGSVVQKHVGTAATEYTAGTLVFEGRCQASIVMRRDLRDGNTYRAFTEESLELNARIRDVAAKLGAFGPANFQFRLEDGVPKIFEINARFSGTTPLRAHAGFNEVEMAIRHVLLGDPVIQPEVVPMSILRHWSETVVPAGRLLGQNG